MPMILKARLADSTNVMVLQNFGTNCQGPCYVKDSMFFIENENAHRYTKLHRTSLVTGFEISYTGTIKTQKLFLLLFSLD